MQKKLLFLLITLMFGGQALFGMKTCTKQPGKPRKPKEWRKVTLTPSLKDVQAENQNWKRLCERGKYIHRLTLDCTKKLFQERTKARLKKESYGVREEYEKQKSALKEEIGVFWNELTAKLDCCNEAEKERVLQEMNRWQPSEVMDFLLQASQGAEGMDESKRFLENTFVFYAKAKEAYRKSKSALKDEAPRFSDCFLLRKKFVPYKKEGTRLVPAVKLIPNIRVLSIRGWVVDKEATIIEIVKACPKLRRIIVDKESKKVVKKALKSEQSLKDREIKVSVLSNKTKSFS